MDDALSVENLLAGARRFAHLAMAAHDRSDHELFALHGGVAVERLAKAALAAKSPALLLEMRGKVDALFHLTGVKPSVSRVHTVGAGEAIARLRKLDVLPGDSGLDDLIELRNGVAHATQGDEGRELLPTLVRTVELLLADLGVDTTSFWDRWVETVRLALDEARTELERDVRLRIQKARNVFEERFMGLPDDARERFQKSQGNVFNMVIMAEENLVLAGTGARCPACDSQAEVTMQGLDSEPGYKALTANGLRCSMCHLVISGAAEFEAAGLDLGSLNEATTSELLRLIRPRDDQTSKDVRLGVTRSG
ncbi:hypothetical protein [Streptomyces xylophagus]|uniref:hypothetical protein n=1 Tax=Streptomyces xylophagus TaxID=285514 RepID=UPI00068A3E8A|nr:hypothetical protein [Streptomyces xylophagus]